MHRIERAMGKLTTASKVVDHFLRHYVWLKSTGWSGHSAPIYIFGSQRSGTTMLGRCLGWSPEIENLGEFDQRLFNDFSLRDNQVVIDYMNTADYPFVVLKPLKDSHRVEELLDLFENSQAIWMYRNYLDRINSAVRKFGKHPLDVFLDFKKNGTRAWQLAGLSRDDSDMILSLDIEGLSVYDAAALMWYVRNALYFNQELAGNTKVTLLSYEEFVGDSQNRMESIAGAFGFRFSSKMVKDVHSSSVRKNEYPQLSGEISSLCEEMYSRLERSRHSKIHFDEV